ncbi:MAG: hypothetical protein LUQ59_02765 [Methanothrix sp.]|nr:hypothetical protein [Methanothrix sp.]
MEEIGEILSRGFGVWKRNLNLCIPFLLNIIASMLIFLPILAAIIVTIMPIDSLNDLNQASLQDAGAMQEMLTQIGDSLKSLPGETILQVAGLFLAVIVLISLINSFFTAGAIGMARQALENGRSDTSSMWSAGRRHFFGLFLATLLIELLTLSGMIFILPGIIMGGEPLPKDPEALGLLAVGLFLFVFLALALSVIMVAVPYALVVDGHTPVQSISESIKFFRYNKFDVAVLWLLMAAFSLGLQMIGGIAPAGSGASSESLSAITSIINLLVLAPLSNLWWTRLYMSRRGILKVAETEDPW